MDSYAQELTNKRDKVLDLISELRIKSNKAIDDSPEFYGIQKKLDEAHELYKELTNELVRVLPPVKTGTLVDLKSAGSPNIYLIYLHGESVEVGGIRYRPYNRTKRFGDVGYHIDPPYQNNGYATEALALLGEKLFEDGITDMWVSVRDYNGSSKRVAEKNNGKIIYVQDGVILYEVPTRLRTLDNDVNNVL